MRGGGATSGDGPGRPRRSRLSALPAGPPRRMPPEASSTPDRFRRVPIHRVRLEIDRAPVQQEAFGRLREGRAGGGSPDRAEPCATRPTAGLPPEAAGLAPRTLARSGGSISPTPSIGRPVERLLLARRPSPDWSMLPPAAGRPPSRRELTASRATSSSGEPELTGRALSELGATAAAEISTRASPASSSSRLAGGLVQR